MSGILVRIITLVCLSLLVAIIIIITKFNKRVKLLLLSATFVLTLALALSLVFQVKRPLISEAKQIDAESFAKVSELIHEAVSYEKGEAPDSAENDGLLQVVSVGSFNTCFVNNRFAGLCASCFTPQERDNYLVTTFRVNQDGYLYSEHSRAFDPAASYQEPLPLYYLKEIIDAIGSSKTVAEISKSGSNAFSFNYDGYLMLGIVDEIWGGESAPQSHKVFVYKNGELLEINDKIDVSWYFLFSMVSDNTSYWILMPDKDTEAISY